MRIYLSPPEMIGKEFDYLKEAFTSNWIAPVGPFLKRFETSVCNYTGCKDAVALASGTAGIDLALRILGIQKGDRVICPSMTFAASIAPAVHLGAIPVFIDSEIDGWNLCPDLLEDELHRAAKSNELPKAIIAVHLYGYAANMERICGLAGEYKIPLIEDAAESLGCTLNEKHTGTFGDFGIFSFNGNKIITTSNGGLLTSTHSRYVELARHLSTQAKEPLPFYEHKQLGYNYRMSNLLAAIGLGQMEILDEKIEKRRANFSYYRERLSALPGFSFVNPIVGSQPSNWLSVVCIDEKEFGTSKEEIRLALLERDIESRPAWKPMHLQPVFTENPSSYKMVGGQRCEMLFDQGLCLPSGSLLTSAELDEICTTIEQHSR